MDEGITGVGRPSNGDDIEANRNLSQGSITLKEGKGSSRQLLLFALVDRGHDLLDRFWPGGLGGADLDNYQGLSVQSEEVDFARREAEIGGEEDKLQAAEMGGNRPFTAVAKPPPPPRPTGEVVGGSIIMGRAECPTPALPPRGGRVPCGVVPLN